MKNYLYWFHEESPMFDDSDDNPDMEFLHEIADDDLFPVTKKLIQRN